MPKIELRQLSRIFDGDEGLHPTDLHVDDGEFVAIVGPSGSGKSTLLRLIAGLEQPDQGEIVFDGRVMNDVPSHNRGVGLVVSTGALYTNMSAGRNIAFPLEIEGVDEPGFTQRVAATARRFTVSRLLERKPDQLSAGQRQLVATGRAVIRDSDVVLFDEALSGIDPHKRERIKTELRKLHAAGHTVLFATNTQEEAMAMGTTLVVLRAGRIQQVGTPSDVYRDPDNSFVAEFMGGANLVAGMVNDDGTIVLGDDTIELSDLPRRGNGPGKVVVGIRPEEVEIADPATPFRRCIHARVTHVENLGDHRMVHVSFGTPDSGSLDFSFRNRTSPGPQPGQHVELSLGRGLFFDAADGRRLRAD
jgi:lactose/L-arabinose transport system ATP-binding protein